VDNRKRRVCSLSPGEGNTLTRLANASFLFDTIGLMAASSASTQSDSPWQLVAQRVLHAEPLAVLDALAVAVADAEKSGDLAAQTALSANALAFMVMDWSRFTDWRGWIMRFDAAEATLAARVEPDLRTACIVGKLAAGLLRGDVIETLAPLGQQLESLTEATQDNVQLALAAGVLLPWFQMSRNMAAAQALHGRMAAFSESAHDAAMGAQYLRGLRVASWAQHLHFSDRARLPDAIAALDDFLATTPTPHLQFRRARLAAEQCLRDKDMTGAERASRDMLNALHAKRPMERAIYNSIVATVACASHHVDEAALHVKHMQRDLDAADCPPSLAMLYRLVASRVTLASGDYAQAITIIEPLAATAHSAHAATLRGFVSLLRALIVHRDEPASTLKLCEHLQTGLALMRAVPTVSFFFASPEARGAVCALALREGIEVEFVRSALQLEPVPAPVWADEHWPWAVSVRCFGGFKNVAVTGASASGKSSRAEKASNRPQSLLMLVAAHGSAGISVSLAADALWPGQDGDQAENSLTVTLMRLRRTLDAGDWIERSEGHLRLNFDRVWTDVAALEAHLEQPPQLGAGLADRIAYIARLFDLYRGDCLQGVDDEWALLRAAHYRGRVTLATQQLLQSALQAGQAEAAELLLTHVVNRGLDVSRLMNAVHPNLRATPAWAELQRHVGLLQAL
jgi:LuxR family transcriptional regulator, maltose regulon positive regulatory protein